MSVNTSSSSQTEAAAAHRSDTSQRTSIISQKAARVSLAASITTLVLLASLHLLSPEFDPSWRMVSEYALGNYTWVLSAMFIAWGVSSWALALTIWPHVRTLAGRIGLLFLVLAGIGEAMASVFDISHPLHSAAALIGIPSFPVAAMILGVSLSRTQEWSAARKPLLWTSNLTWISLILMAAAFGLLIATFTQAGGDMTAPAAVLPPGVIALVGWANRLLIVAYCAWAMTVTWYALKMPSSDAS
jgi:hypothetical protein